MNTKNQSSPRHFNRVPNTTHFSLPETGLTQGPGDPLSETRPHRAPDPLSETRYHHVLAPKKRSPLNLGCGCLSLIGLGLLALLALYLFFPWRTNILLLGLDSRPNDGYVARTDTIILTTFLPFQGYVGVLSIPRDLWVNIPGHGVNRINTAHFFAEAEHSGSGPAGAEQAIRQDFGVNADYYARLRFTGFKEVVDAMGGVDVNLPQAMAGFPAGVQHLDGTKALALVRERETSSDFFRMDRGQLFLKAVVKKMLSPAGWVHIPGVMVALPNAIDSDVPFWLWPRLAFNILRAGPNGIDTRTINLAMVTPFTTSDGAQVLGPNWNKINPVLMEMFGQ